MRIPFDNYDTPPELALAATQWCSENVVAQSSVRILDPMAGAGAWVKAARTVWPGSWIAGIDIRPETFDSIRESGANWVGIKNVFDIAADSFAPVELVITNPAFNQADRLLRHLYNGLKDGAHVVFLLNITFIGSEDRWTPAGGLFTFALPRFVLPVVPRPSFLMVDGRPAQPKFEAGLFVWRKGEPGACTIPGALRWVKPRVKRGRRKVSPLPPPSAGIK